jgi:uncharacterized protein (DUF427 family)
MTDSGSTLSEGNIMGLAWQQGPLAPGTVGCFLVSGPLPERLPFAEPLRRRMRVRYSGAWIADSEDVVLLHEPGRYPVAYFPVADIASDTLVSTGRRTTHRDLGTTAWFAVERNGQRTENAAWMHTELASHARVMEGRVAFAWRAMDAFYEEDDRIVGHAADAYHRIDIRRTSRHLIVRTGNQIVADTTRPLVLHESGFAPRWYVPRADTDLSALRPVEGQTFCPYKGLASYFEVAGIRGAAWSYEDAWAEVRQISGFVSFEPDKLDVSLDGVKLALQPGQTVIAHGVDRDLSVDEVAGADRRLQAGS